MRLPFDEQLSDELFFLLRDVFPDAVHVRHIGAGGAPEAMDGSWRTRSRLPARDERRGFSSVLSILRRAPPKVVWLRLGNCSTRDVARVLREHVADLRAFAEQTEATFLELG